MRIAYFTNQYPKVSHSFIRSEIQALERLGLPVRRYALRGWEDELADPLDLEERRKTRYVLAEGGFGLVAAMVSLLFQAPSLFLRALGTAVRFGVCSPRGLLRHLAYLAEACVLRSWCHTEGIEHVHAHFGTNPAAVATLLRLLGGPPYSFTVHGPEEFDAPVALSLGEKIQHSAFVVAVSSFGRSQLYRWVGHAHWGKVHVVRCGLDNKFSDGAGLPVAETPRLVCVGRLCEQKGQLLLVEAVAALAAEGLALELVLAGDGELRDEVESLVAVRGLQSRVRVTGWLSSARVREEILAARAMVLPSFAEGLPVVIMEALALGRPVVTTYVAGIPELMTRGETGWLIPAGDVHALIAALREVLLANPVELDAMGRQGRAVVLERHDVNLEAAKLVRLFRNAAASGGGNVLR